MNPCIYLIFALKELFEKFCGVCYPMELVELIVLILYKPIQISAGHRHTIIISNKIYVWGNNDSGQLGLGDNIARYSPQELLLNNIKSISCGLYHTVALTEYNKIYVWGSNDTGQLGLGDRNNKNLPQQLVLSDINSISCGMYHTCVLTNFNKIYGWGCNSAGQLGLGDDNSRTTPQELILHNVEFESISCGGYHTIALTKHAEIYVWGSNKHGQLGLGDFKNIKCPQKLSLTNIKSIICGGYYTIALTMSNTIYSWGDNDRGQLGLGDTTNRNSPQKVNLNNIKSVSCGLQHTIVLTMQNNVYGWGHAVHGHAQSSLNVGTDKSSPQKLILENVKSVSCGTFHTIALINHSSVYVWGSNECGKLGLGDCVEKRSPHKLEFEFKF